MLRFYWIIILLGFVLPASNTTINEPIQACQSDVKSHGKSPCSRADDQCLVPPEERADCGYAGITVEECTGKGCCHNSTTGEIQAPHCFYPYIYRCMFDVEDRRDCGYSGISPQECGDRGCCHNSTTGGISAPHCFFPEITPCDVADNDRRDCGFYGISTEECEGKGCCFVPADGDAPFCFPKTMDPFTTFVSNGEERHDIWFLTHRNSFSFTVAACQEVHVYLRKMGYSDSNGYRFELGSENQNKRIIMRKYVNDEEVDYKEQESYDPLLNCTVDKSFVIEWGDQNLLLRTGFDNELLVYEDPELLSISEIRLFTINTKGRWTFQNNMGRVINVGVVGQEPEAGKDLVYETIWNELRPQQTAITFKIGGQKEAYMVLCENSNNINAYAYEIAIGTKENMYSHIKNRQTNKTMEISTPDILKGYTDMTPFWVSWKDGHVQLGHGSTVGQDKFLEEIYDQYNVRFISMANRGQHADDMAYFELRRYDEDMFYFKTLPDEGGEGDVWENRAHFNTYSTHVFFTVHTCSNAYIYLATDTTAYRFEVILGYQGNTEISVKVYTDDSTRVKRKVDGLVDCLESRIFWINWIDDHLVVGKGTTLNQHPLITFHNSVRTNDITGIAFRSKEHPAEWTMEKQFAYQAVFQPDNNKEYDYWLDLGHTTSVHTAVKACSDVHFLFTEHPGVVDRSAEVVLGAQGNTANLILDGYGGRTLKSFNLTVLECDRLRYIWFSWADDHFRVGTGTGTGQHEIMVLPLNDFTRHLNVYAMGVASYAADIDEPLVQFATENEVASYTYFSKLENNRALQFITHKKYFMFRVRVCSNAIVILSNNPELTIADWYEIQIGSDDSKRITILQNGNTIKSELMPDALLSCEDMKSFWISWPDEKLCIGSGDAIGESELLCYQDDNTEFIQAIHSVKLETRAERDGKWVIGREYAVSTMITTEARKTYNNIWLNVEKESHIVFSVKALNESYIVLGSMTGTPGLFESVEVRLASPQSTISSIHQQTTTQLVAVNTTELLSESEHRYFWISWHYGNFQVGTGSVVSQNTFMSYQFISSEHYIMMALSSGFGVGQAHWSIAASEDNFVELKTAALYFEETQYYHLTQSFKFKLKACRNAHIGMFAGSDYKDKSYEMVIGARDNTVTYVKRQYAASWPPEQEISTLDILHCHEDRGFTLLWGPAGISLTGDNGKYYYNWVDTDFLSVDFLSFATNGVIGLWYFPRSSGDRMNVTTYSGEVYKHANQKEKIRTDKTAKHQGLQKQGGLHQPYNIVPGEYKYNTMWLALTDHKAVRFSVQACAEAHVVISKYYGVADFESFEFRIGEHQDNFVRIYTDRTTECDSEEIEVLECNELKPFWISWDKGSMQIGEGDLVGQLPIISCKISSSDYGGLSIATDKGEGGTWLFDGFRGEELTSFWTDNNFPYWTIDKVWMVPRQDWLTVEVQTREWVVLTLCEQPWISDTKCHEIHIGKQLHSNADSQYSYIVDKDKEESPVVSIITPEAVKENTLNAYWVSWTNGLIQVGFGYGKNAGAVIMEIPYPLPHMVNAVGFATPKTDSRWEVPRDLARQLHIRFPSDTYETNKIETSIRGLNSLVFQAISSESVQVSLVTNAGTVGYTFIIGYENNRFTALYDGRGEAINIKETPDILDPVITRPFWISWDQYGIHFGRGDQAGYDVVITEKVDIPSFYKAIYHGSSHSESQFIFVELLGPTYNILSSSVWGYDIAWMEPSTTEISFRVRACADAHILLAQDLMVVEEYKVYEIVLGGSGNTILYLRRGPLVHDLELVFIDNMVDCNALRRFWVSWDDNTIRVGSGYRSQGHVYLKYIDYEFIPVNYIAVSSGYGSVGEWEIEHKESEGIILYTPESEDYNYEDAYITFQGQNAAGFLVKACSDAHVALSEVPNIVTFNTYEVVFGYDSNGYNVGIRFGLSGDFLTEKKTSHQLLNCDEFKGFWITWDGSSFTIGEGETTGKSILLDYKTSTPYFAINGISFKTGNSVKGEWRYISVTPGPGGSSSLSGGAVAGIVIGVLVAIIMLVAVILIFFPPARIKAEQWYLVVRNKFSSPDPATMSVDPSVLASDVGFESNA